MEIKNKLGNTHLLHEHVVDTEKFPLEGHTSTHSFDELVKDMEKSLQDAEIRCWVYKYVQRKAKQFPSLDDSLLGEIACTIYRRVETICDCYDLKQADKLENQDDILTCIAESAWDSFDTEKYATDYEKFCVEIEKKLNVFSKVDCNKERVDNPKQNSDGPCCENVNGKREMIIETIEKWVCGDVNFKEMSDPALELILVFLDRYPKKFIKTISEKLYGIDIEYVDNTLSCEIYSTSIRYCDE